MRDSAATNPGLFLDRKVRLVLCRFYELTFPTVKTGLRFQPDRPFQESWNHCEVLLVCIYKSVRTGLF